MVPNRRYGTMRVNIRAWDEKISDKYGGWLGEQVVDDFADYARVCYKAFGDLVNFWITINEPHVVAHQGSISFQSKNFHF